MAITVFACTLRTFRLSLHLVKTALRALTGRPNIAHPTRFHYVEILEGALQELGLTLSTPSQNCLAVTDTTQMRELLIVVRYATPGDLRLVELRKRTMDSRVAFLIDDDYWAMQSDTSLRRDYRDQLKHFLKRRLPRLMQSLDVIVAPSQQILDRIPDKPGVIMPPAHLSPQPDLSHFNVSERVEMVFLGTGTHAHDLKGVAEGIRAALASSPKLHLTTFLGQTGNKIIPAGPQATHLKKMPFAEFQNWLNTARFHIGIAPYAPNEVNSARSYLKVHQHALVGAAGVYTDAMPFCGFVQDGVSGLLVDYSAGVWGECILDLSSDMQRARLMAEGGLKLSQDASSCVELAQGWRRLLRER